MSEVLSVKGLTKRYPSFTLDDVSFGLRLGAITGFIGRNGAGKSTTFKCLLNLVHPDGGDIFFFGQPFAGNEFEAKQKLGFVLGGVDYYPTKKLKTITAVTRRFYPTWSEDAYRRYMAEFKLDENKTPRQLSEGMKVKSALTLALSHHASLPVRKRDTVKARFLLVSLLQIGQMALMALCIAVKDVVLPLDNPAGLEANAALIGLCLIAFGIFNLVFFSMYYKDPPKIGVPFVIGTVVIFLLISLEVMATLIVPFVRDKLDTRYLLFMPEKLAVLGVGAIVYVALTLISYRKSVKSFEGLDL